MLPKIFVAGLSILSIVPQYASAVPTLTARQDSATVSEIDKLMGVSLTQFETAFPSLDSAIFDTSSDGCSVPKPSEIKKSIKEYVKNAIKDFFSRMIGLNHRSLFEPSSIAAVAYATKTLLTMSTEELDALVTQAGNNPFGFPFKRACARHDFGYRNYKKQQICGESQRGKIDRTFAKDMANICLESNEKIGRKALCLETAFIYWLGVHEFGESSFC